MRLECTFVISFFLVIVNWPAKASEKITGSGVFLNNEPVPSISYALKRAFDGSEILIKAGVYNDGGVLNANSVTIRGEIGTHLKGYAAEGKATLIINGNDTQILNIECSGVRVSDGNGACIRLKGENLTIENVFFHDSEQGMLSGKNSGTVTIENSRFERLGFAGRAHAIYVGGGELYIHNSKFLSSKDEGHEIKSRAEKTIISNSTIASLNEKDSRLLDIPNGGVLSIKNSVLQQGNNTSNWNLIGYGLEGIKHKKNTVDIKRNIFILDRDGGSLVFHKRGNVEDISLTENIIVGKFHDTNLIEDNFVFENRGVAGIKAFPFLPERQLD
ncbi:hypothetical protein HII17_15915 [Thalassotalea sp. M1531]|uniref:Right handed beta helix domain-containing protein n=1 Tax=Thalassotalea algicola TaxID=2716224 RepID=A0A7Y0LF54_9GAMM|nr:hypothetical protein [Thalassotalea algicola]NMP33044.1 hypothetical protein [Thalassotalea algicola]